MHAPILRWANANTARINLACTTMPMRSYPKHKAQGGLDFRAGWLFGIFLLFFFQIFLWKARVTFLGEKRACFGALSRASSTLTQTHTCKHTEIHTLHCLSTFMSSSSGRRPVEQYLTGHVRKAGIEINI